MYLNSFNDVFFGVWCGVFFGVFYDVFLYVFFDVFLYVFFDVFSYVFFDVFSCGVHPSLFYFQEVPAFSTPPFSAVSLS